MGNVLENEVKPIHKMGIYEKYIKRPLDFILSLCAILVLSPVLLLVAILVKIKLGSPVIFKQERPGLYGKIFNMYKFRTMTDEKDENGNLLSDEKRLTGFGKMLRSTSLDELPQLFNVLKGDMSLVGPRPPIPREVIQYNKYQYQRLLVKPGITCYWQISGRNNIDFDEWVELDLKYIKERNLFKDIYIILMTLPVLLGDKNAS